MNRPYRTARNKLAANHVNDATRLAAMRTEFALRSIFDPSYQMVLLAVKPICTRNMAKVKPGALLERIKMETGRPFA
jgi:hypothetical protein